jgi:hypothetical protein
VPDRLLLRHLNASVLPNGIHHLPNSRALRWEAFSNGECGMPGLRRMIARTRSCRFSARVNVARLGVAIRLAVEASPASRLIVRDDGSSATRYSRASLSTVTEGIDHGRIGESPASHVAPYVSIWAIEGARTPELIGWWVICGDVPADYMTGDQADNPRDAARVFARRWSEGASYILGTWADDAPSGCPISETVSTS